MKALTLWQPWATLLADPRLPKWIETRSRPTKVRGRIAIHAAKSPAGIYNDDSEYEGGWAATMVGPYQACYCYSSSDEGWLGDTWMVKVEGDDPAPDFAGPLPLGAVIGTVDLYDCVPIDAFDPSHDVGWPHVCLDESAVASFALLYPGSEEIHYGDDISDQLPYGDFTPGRWAWLTRDAELFTEPVPAKGRQGWWEWSP